MQGATLLLALAGGAALVITTAAQASVWRFAAVAVYCGGLLAMSVCSALYGCARDGPHHTLFRQLDQAAIFLLIAGTYTPLIQVYGGGEHGRLLGMVWTIALAGALSILAAPRRLEMLTVPLYLLLGWAALSDPALLGSMSTRTVLPLVLGGMLYTVGVLFHRSRIRFQEAIWHGFVLAGATSHYVAIAASVTS